MTNINDIDELNEYLKVRDKEGFLKRYQEVLEKSTALSEDYFELKLLHFTYSFLFVGDFEQLNLEVKEVEKILFSHGTNLQKIRFLVYKGIVLGRLNQTEKAIKVYNKALELSNDEKLASYKISILTNIGVIYFRENNYVKSLKYLLTAYELNNETKSQVKLTSLLVNIGLIYLQLDMYSKAIYYLELSLTTITKSREYAKVTIYNNLLAAYSAYHDFEKAEKIIALCEAAKSKFNQADELNYHKSLAIYYLERADFRKAIGEYKDVLSRLTSANSLNNYKGYQIALAKVYLELKEYDKCKEIIDEINPNGDFVKSLASYSSYLELKEEYYTEREDFQSALKCSAEIIEIQKKQFKELEKDVFNELTIHLHDQRSNISNEAFEEKIEELEFTNKELNEQKGLLVHSLNDLRNESKLREKIISIISHDLRGPLGSIIQLLDVIDEYEDENEKDEIIAEVIIAMKQAYSLTNELVDWAKEIIDARKVNLTSLNVKDIIDEIDQLYRQQLDSKHIFITNNLSEDKHILGHKTSIKTCFRNIIQNAIKFSEAYSRIEINQQINHTSIIYSIHDFGQGISPEGLASLFDVSKISKLGTNLETGIGIGLLLVKELVVKNHGKIWCESVLGQGSTFYLSFPLNEEDN